MKYNRDYRPFQYPIVIQFYLFFLEKFHLQQPFSMLDEVQYEFDDVDQSLLPINNRRICQLEEKENKREYSKGRERIRDRLSPQNIFS